MFGTWETTEKLKGNRVNSMSWRISVDVGFRYLIRIHFCDVGLKVVEADRKDFTLVINDMIVSTSGDLLQERGNQSNLLYNNYMVIVGGHKREGKRDIFLSLQSDHVLDRHGLLEGFEVFKLSNHDYNLASPNPLLPKRDSSLQPIQILLSLLGRINALAIVLFAAIYLVKIIVYMLQQKSVSNITEEEESKPSTRAKRLCRRFSLAEIQFATDNFHEAFVIGKGGFGKVYRGLIDNAREIVAIKRLKPDSKQGKHEFWTEVETLSELRHVNLVSLIGYCNDQPEMILVYEYMPCGTLADHLYKRARENNAHHPLSWKQRQEICIGAGRGLEYLHRGLESEIIHRDVKASNILIDEKFVAKVSDFGLAKIKSGSKPQNDASTNLKGTFGYMDPAYFRSRRLTIESDTYSFGVVLLEVLCGRPAVEPWVEEDKRSLTLWARDNIVKGQVDHIVDPSLREEISPNSLKTFVRIAENFLLDEPKRRPAIAHVVMILQFALEQQDHTESLVSKERARIADIIPSTDKSPKENTFSFVIDDKSNVGLVDSLPGVDRTIISVTTGLAPASSDVQNFKSLPSEQINSHVIISGKKDEKQSIMHKISRKLLSWDALWKSGKSSKKKDVVSRDLSAPIHHRTSKMALSGSAASQKLWPWNELWKTGKSSKKKDVVNHALSAPVHRRFRNKASRGSTASGNSRFSAASGSDQTNPRSRGQVLPHPNLRIFTFSELKAASRNFKDDMVLGEGGFGIVYKGLLDEKIRSEIGSGIIVAIKKLNSESMQGFYEWQSEVNFLGRLTHPNLVRLLGYCSEDKELLLVYEFMQKGSLENHLFRRNPSSQPLPWDTRLKILIGAARGLAFLHCSERQVIYRDFKASNILLDSSYHAKISDFGLAKLGPSVGNSHVSTQVMGTYGYAAPEYIATGRLYVKSDVYGFGVVLLEMFTGLRALDTKREAGKQNLVDWIKPHLSERKMLKHTIDARLEGKLCKRSAFQIAQLALNCLQNEPRNRPSMQEVVEILEKVDAAVEEPRQPRVHFTRS